jgi:hypothetical protein
MRRSHQPSKNPEAKIEKKKKNNNSNKIPPSSSRLLSSITLLLLSRCQSTQKELTPSITYIGFF